MRVHYARARLVFDFRTACWLCLLKVLLQIVCIMQKSDFPLDAYCDLMRASLSVFRVLIGLVDYLSAERRNDLMAIAASIEDFAVRMKVEYYG